MTTFDDRYADVLDEYDDPADQAFVGLLGASLQPKTPPATRVAIAEAVHEQARCMTSRPEELPAWRRAILHRRSLLVGVALLAAVIVTGAVYAYSSLLNQAYRYTPSLGAAMMKYAHPVHVAGSACGYTLTVLQVYADANRLTIGYTLGGPPKRHFVSEESDWAVVTAARGRRLKPLTGGMSTAVIRGAEGAFQSFDASNIAQTTHRLALRMTFPAPTMVEQLDGAQPPAVPCERYQPFGTITTAGYSGPARLVTVRAPLSVALNVPVDPARRIVELHQTVMSGGTALTLQRVVVTRTEARVYLKRTAPGHILENLSLMLRVGKRDYGEGIPLFADWWVRKAPAGRLYDFWFEGPFYAYHGPWTLTARPQPGVQPADWRMVKGGPWIYHFRMP